MNSKTLLIVDEDKENSQSLGKILEGKFSMKLVKSSSEALEFMHLNPGLVSAVIASDELKKTEENIDSYELIAKLHGSKGIYETPVIIVSKNNSREAELKAMTLGANDFIRQPYDPEILYHRVMNVIQLHETAVIATAVSRDELTGLYTKPYFLMRAAQLLQIRGEKLYDFLCIDIEKFKLVNDAYGIPMGNKILRHVANVLKTAVFDLDGIVGHFSQDIFYVLVERFPEYNDENVGSWFKKINEFPDNINKEIKLKLVCGIYHIHNMKVPLSVMCDRAKMAAEKIKGRYGQNFCVYDDSIRKRLLSDQKLTDSMENSLKNGEFEIYYQPKYELQTERVAGAEALVRWNHPEMGFLSPGLFIPLFENNGFITQLDMFVWETVCRDLHEWKEKGNSLVAVSINVSRADIYNPNLVSTLVNLIKKYDIPPKYLHLEITESAYTEDPEQIVKVIYELRKYDFPIEMDDFGSGYSSLNMLSDMPIDVLKLDMGFVKNEMERTNGKGILSFVISLAKWLDLAVVAEGVETGEQIKQLKLMDCNYVQGFYYARPLPKKEFFELLGKGNIAEMKLDSAVTIPGAEKNKTHEELINSKEKIGGTMLIVDDIESSRAILAEGFRNEYDIQEAENGQEAWNYLEENYQKVSIVLMDLIMPVMDGFQLLGKIRGDSRMQNLPVIVTSQGDEQSEMRALGMNADDFLSKPYNPEILRHRVRNVVAHSKVQKLEEERQLTQKLLEIERQAHTDFLTGLDNRIILEKAVGEFFGKSTESFDSVFIILDVDDFKTINDTLGHLTGDETIKKVAKILKSFFKNKEVVCRMGGDEFSIFIPRKIDDINKYMENLTKTLRFQVEALNVSCSIGVAVSPEFGMDYQTLYNNADMALLSAKRYGKNQFNVFNGQSVLPSYVFYRNMDWILDEFNDAVYVCYADSYDLFYVNKTACKIAKKEKKDCVGKKCYEALWGRKEPCEFCIKSQELKQDFVQKEIQPTKNRRSYTMRTKAVNWSGYDARIQYLSDNSFAVDMAQQYKNISDNYAKIIDVLPCGFFKYSAEGETDLITLGNEKLLSMLGYTREEFKEKFKDHFSKIICEEDRERVLSEINNKSKTSSFVTTRYRMQKKDGSYFEVLHASHLIKESDGRKWFYVNVIDTEIELKPAQKKSLVHAAALINAEKTSKK